MQKFDFKKLMPHLVIVVAMAIICMIYFAPNAFKGMELNAHDNISWKGMSEEARAYYEKTGEQPLWSNSMFGGMPTYTTYLVEENNLVIKPQFLLEKIMGLSHFIFLAMLSMYVLLNVLRVNRWLSIAGALAYGFSTYNPIIIAAGHYTKMLDIAYIPLVISGLILLYRGKFLGGAALWTFALALLFSNKHYQIIYYAAMLIGFIIIGLLFKAIKEGTLKRYLTATVIVLFTTVLSVGPSLVSLWTTAFDLNKETMRGGKSELTINHDPNKKGGLDIDYAFRWSNDPGESFCVLIPYLYGGSSSEPGSHAPKTEEMTGRSEGLPLYWGTQPFLSGPVYFGAIVCFLFVLGIMVIKHPVKWWLLGISAISFLMAMGKNLPSFNNFLFEHLPMFNSFRTPSMILVIPQFVFPFIGIWGLSELLKKHENGEPVWNNIKWASIATAGLAVLIGLFYSMTSDFSNPAVDSNYPAQLVKALKEDRSSLALKSAFTSAVYIVLAAAALWAMYKKMIKPTVAVIAIGLLICIDLLSVNSNYLNESNYVDKDEYALNFKPRPVDAQILRDPDPYYRVLDFSKNVFNDAIQAYIHKCVGGYSPAKLEIYQDLIDIHLGGRDNKFNQEVLNMLNTKYIIFPTGNGQVAYQPNPGACGNAWFVNSIQWAKTADEEILAMNAGTLGDTTPVADAFRPLEKVIFRENQQNDFADFTFGKDSSSSIQLVKYGLNDLEFTSRNAQNGLAVFSDIYYKKGWEAYIDGRQVPIYRANYVLRALQVPAGEHKITFRFNPQSYTTSNRIALISSILVLGLCCAALLQMFKPRKEA